MQIVAAVQRQKAALCFGFHPLRHHLQPEIVRQCNGRGADRGRVASAFDIALIVVFAMSAMIAVVAAGGDDDHAAMARSGHDDTGRKCQNCGKQKQKRNPGHG